MSSPNASPTAQDREASVRPAARRAGTWLPAFLLLAAIWGCSFAFIEVSLHALTPVQVAAGRLILGAAALLAVSAATRTRLPRGRRAWKHLAVLGALLSAVPFTLFAYGQQHVSSVLAGMINAATPLATLLVILLAFPEEKPTRDKLLGLLVGFAGVCVVIGAWRGFTAGQWSGLLACLAAVGCFGVAFPYARRHLSATGEPPIALATGQVVLAAVMMLPPLLLTGIDPPGAVNASAIVAILLLGVLGSGVAYVLNFAVVAAAGASTASTVTYLTPVVAAGVGVALLGERVSWNEPVGGIVVLTGVALAQGRLRITRSAPSAQARRTRKPSSRRP